MEEQPPSTGVSGNSVRPKLQRYALRSSSKIKENKPHGPDSSEPKSGISTPTVSRSVGVLDFSGKEKSTSAKPPRRLSIPAKSSATPRPKQVGNITPISETRALRSANAQEPQSRTQTPFSDISRTSSRIKFNLLSSSSYWLNQIKLSESAAKHSVSLGFFKLALDAGCEPFQKMQDELKAYLGRHLLAGLGEPVKELLESYNITENIGQSQVSESVSQGPDEGTRSSDDEVHCDSSSAMDTAKLKPKCLNHDSTTQLSPPVTIEPTKKETGHKTNPGSRLRENLRKNPVNSRSATDSWNRMLAKKSEKPTKQQPNKEKSEGKKQGKKSDVKEVPISPTRGKENVQGNKENMEVQTHDGIGLTEFA